MPKIIDYPETAYMSDDDLLVLEGLFGTRSIKKNDIFRPKNLLGYTLESLKANNTDGTWSGNVYTVNGITFTVNDDGLITANGTCTNNNDFIISDFFDTHDILGFLLTGGFVSTNQVRMIVRYYDGSKVWKQASTIPVGESEIVIGTKTSFNPNDYPYIQIGLRIYKDAVVNNLTIYPMIRDASVEDDTYEPYKPYMPYNELLDNIGPFQNAGFHNSIYRGKYLGDHVTAEQYAVIADGSFNGMYIGDFWEIANIIYRIAAFNYWLNTGNPVCIIPHILLVPDACIGGNQKMNDTNTTTGGYPGSKMYTEYMNEAKAIIQSAFSGHILSHLEYLANAMSNGKPSAAAWYDSTIDLMNEHMVYGSKFFEVGNDGATVPAIYTVDKTQLPLFALDPSRITNRSNWWLRDPVSAANFAHVNNNGVANHLSANGSLGVRPVFAIKA